MRHTLSLLVENKPGTLTRVTGLIARRGFNIESLSVGITEDATFSRVTVVVEADEVAVEQIIKQLPRNAMRSSRLQVSFALTWWMSRAILL